MVPYCTKTPIVWNQQIKNGNFDGTSFWYPISATFTASNNIGYLTANTQYGRIGGESFNLKANHKYYIHSYVSDSNVKMQLRYKDETNSVFSVAPENNYINVVAESSGDIQVYVRFLDFRSSGWTTVGISDVMVCDLTQMFGSDAAIVAALGLDSVSDITAKSGAKAVAAFHILFPQEYYAHRTQPPKSNPNPFGIFPQ